MRLPAISNTADFMTPPSRHAPLDCMRKLRHNNFAAVDFTASAAES